MMLSIQRWRGVVSVVQGAVKYGSIAIESAQKNVAKVPFAVLEAIPPIALPSKVAHVIHDASVTGVHGMVRLVNGVVGKGVDVALSLVDDDKR